MSDKQPRSPQLAAGGVLLGPAPDGKDVLLVHRPRYNDWSFPKGKLDSGETLEQAALREVREETGLECSIVRELGLAEYDKRTADGDLRRKHVHYFLMRPAGGTLRSHKDDEIDAVEWVPAGVAMERLTYEFDRQLLRSVAATYVN
jgi:8-oxo-dGTP diphosphatase